jgi:hypothetical protein
MEQLCISLGGIFEPFWGIGSETFALIMPNNGDGTNRRSSPCGIRAGRRVGILFLALFQMHHGLLDDDQFETGSRCVPWATRVQLNNDSRALAKLMENRSRKLQPVLLDGHACL